MALGGCGRLVALDQAGPCGGPRAHPLTLDEHLLGLPLVPHRDAWRLERFDARRRLAPPLVAKAR